jgi:hypothetical protein
MECECCLRPGRLSVLTVTFDNGTSGRALLCERCRELITTYQAEERAKAAKASTCDGSHSDQHRATNHD